MTTTQAPRYIDSTTSAKLIKQALKAAWPSVAFSVRRRQGSSYVHVNYTDGPAEEDVQRIADQFTGYCFDPTEDINRAHESVYHGELVSFCLGGVIVNQHISPAEDERIRALVEARYVVDWNAAGSYRFFREVYREEARKQYPTPLHTEVKHLPERF